MCFRGCLIFCKNKYNRQINKMVLIRKGEREKVKKEKDH